MTHAGKRKAPTITSTYDRDVWELHVTIDGKPYVYHDVSPFIADRFHRLARRNRGRALAFLRGKKR